MKPGMTTPRESSGSSISGPSITITGNSFTVASAIIYGTSSPNVFTCGPNGFTSCQDGRLAKDEADTVPPPLIVEAKAKKPAESAEPGGGDAGTGRSPRR